MNTTETKPEVSKPAKRSWRRHSDEFKVRLIAQAFQPHASLACMALANEINANMLRNWMHATSPASGSNTAIIDDLNCPAL